MWKSDPGQQEISRKKQCVLQMGRRNFKSGASCLSGTFPVKCVQIDSVLGKLTVGEPTTSVQKIPCQSLIVQVQSADLIDQPNNNLSIFKFKINVPLKLTFLHQI
ncbi:unnamed protein product [Lymnaea stagnalis]|uniref:Uncharacterized protein n=1 Tax=Lymnaea stagnalis TaxID=6523 RepID=A0AAV2H645_LYMST